MALYALYGMLIDDRIQNILQYSHFWLWVCLFLYFSCTFFFWPCIKILYKQKSPYYDLIVCFQVFMNAVSYLGIGMTLFFYPKMMKNEV